MASVHDDALIRPCDVKEIKDTDLEDSRVANFVNMAYLVTLPLVDNLGACGGDEALKQIQLLLAAHFLTLYDREVKSQSIGGEWSVTYAMTDGEGLNASLYGQQAQVLDCSGTLAKRAAGMKAASFKVTSYRQLAGVTNLFDGDLL